MSDQPAIKHKSGTPLIEALALPHFEVRTARGLGNVMDRWTYPPEQLLVAVSNRLREKDAAVRRKASVLGRLLNRLLLADPDYVEFSGAHLSQLLQGGGVSVPTGLEAGTLYLVRRDIVVSCLNALRETVEAKTPAP